MLLIGLSAAGYCSLRPLLRSKGHRVQVLPVALLLQRLEQPQQLLQQLPVHWLNCLMQSWAGLALL